jgi:hypothetical protein
MRNDPCLAIGPRDQVCRPVWREGDDYGDCAVGASLLRETWPLMNRTPALPLWDFGKCPAPRRALGRLAPRHPCWHPGR